MVEIPKKAREKALSILSRNSQYFYNVRRSNLMAQANEDDKRAKKLELHTQMIDDRTIEANEFINNENFIKIEEFKSFFFKLKQTKLSLQMKLGDSNEIEANMVKKLQEYDPASKNIIIEEARELI